MLASPVFRAYLLGCLGWMLSLGWLPGLAADEAEPTAEEQAAALEQDVTQGALRIVKDDGSVVECPLRHTDVQAEVSGFIARVKVTQTFYNPTDEQIEAVYVFPLPNEAAVDEMTMVVGDRKIVGVIKRRAEARQIYEAALAAGQTAALLEQERPNIFTQSVGNIEPAQEVRIEISYVDVLRYDMGTYEFHFPMVVGPRFMPGAPIALPPTTPAELQGSVSPPVPDTSRVPDASRISPPVLKPGFRNGHDISLQVRLDAGVPVMGLEVANHEAAVDRQGERRAAVTLSPADAIPNKDFVLRYHVLGKKPELAVLAHTGDYTDARRLGKGYFMLMVQPQEDERLTKSPPREIVFLLDVSGSMSGEPTEKVKEAMGDMLKLCREVDTVQVITFANQAQQLFEQPVPVNPGNIAKALNFTQGIRGGGGTHMLEGVKRAIDQPIDKERLRIVIMLTDGYIGNEAEIIEHVGTSCGDQIRFWAIGIGSSPNMFLIDGVARQGGGMGKRLGLDDMAAGLAEEVVSRIQRAQLAKVAIDWGGLQVAETYPARIPELWAGRPVVLFGRYTGGGAAEIKVNGLVEGEPVTWTLPVDLPVEQPDHDVLAKVWARQKIEDLMQQTFYGGSPAVEEEVTAMALDYRLMSQYTSFVAVDAKELDGISNQRPAQPPRRMLVPVPLPAGTRWEGFFGDVGEPLDLRLREKAELATRGRVGRVDALASSSFGMGGMGGMGGGGYGGHPGAMPAAQPAMMAGRRLAASPFTPAGIAPHAGQAAHFYRAQPSPASASPHHPARSPMSRGGTALGLQRSLPALRKTVTNFGTVAEDWVELNQTVAGGDAYTLQALAAAAESLAKASAEQFKTAGKLREEKKLDAAWDAFSRAYFIASAGANGGSYQASGTAQAALAELESLHAERVETWKAATPALGKPLDLVLKDTSVEDALKAIAEAADLSIRLLEGSVQDAEEMLAGRDTRVTYLDLRGVAVADALDWLLQPLRLTWRPDAEGGKVAGIVTGSSRRMPQDAAWVYDVSLIALPSPAEYEGLPDENAKSTFAKACADQFSNAIRGGLNASHQQVMWYAPGQLLVIGSQAVHRQVAATLARLSDPSGQPPADLAALHRLIGQRIAERRTPAQKLRELNRLLETLSVHDLFGWNLLAAALGGEQDAEALTELQIAWRSEETAKLLSGQGAGIALRSAWTIIATSKQLPEDRDLATLADSVRMQCRPAANRAVAALAEHAGELPSVLEAVYAALAMDSDELSGNVLAAIPATSPDPAMAAAAFAARGLLGEPAAGEIGTLIATGGVAGEDLTVLTALACRQAGGEAWTGFRAEMRGLVKKQPLPGSVVVLINRLTGRQPSLAALPPTQ